MEVQDEYRNTNQVPTAWLESQHEVVNYSCKHVYVGNYNQKIAMCTGTALLVALFEPSKTKPKDANTRYRSIVIVEEAPLVKSLN